MEAKYQRIKEIVEKELSCSAHDMEHVIRVYNLCLHLAKHEPGIDLDVLKTAALLHDIARVKEFKNKTGSIDHAALGAEMAERLLITLGYSEEKIVHIKHCIAAHRYRREVKPQTKEAKILFDADKLDVLGAIGVARSFMIAGQYGQKIDSDTSIEEYFRENVVGEKADGRIKDISKHAPNLEFELKFKHIPERLYTQKAREMAEERLHFMENFFERLKTEMKGEL
ncbi:MAG: HD domain-containing protein [Candidatus Bathyarchaeota archaeon]|nr:HD domain-containing protein [Candidatus Bathyarchaeota archaeon]